MGNTRLSGNRAHRRAASARKQCARTRVTTQPSIQQGSGKLRSCHLKYQLSLTGFVVIQLNPSELAPSTCIQKLPDVLSPELEEWVSSQVNNALEQARLKVLLIFLYLK